MHTDDEMEQGATVSLTRTVVRQHIRAVTYQFPSGPVAGFDFRLLVEYPATPEGPTRQEWTPWTFASRESAQKMLDQWQHYITLSGAQPKGPLQ